MSAFSLYIQSNTGGRAENQDSYSSKQKGDGLLVVVCDGMGGTSGGKIAAEMACKIVTDHFAASAGKPTEEIARAIRAANKAVYEKGRMERAIQNMGTTIAALYLEKGQATFFHLGDTRIYHLRNGRVENRTADHSRVGEMVRRGILSGEQARLSTDSNIISKAVGIEPEVEVEVSAAIAYQKGDRFAVCTDGIWGVLPEEQLLRTLSEDQPVQAITNSLIDQINTTQFAAGGDHDNMTLALVAVTGKTAKVPVINTQQLLTIVLSVALAASLIYIFTRPGKTIDKPDLTHKDTTVKKVQDHRLTPHDTTGVVPGDSPVPPDEYKVGRLQLDRLKILVKKLQASVQKDTTGKLKPLVNDLSKEINAITKNN